MCPSKKLHKMMHINYYRFSIQLGFSYLLETREEKLFVNMQHRLQQASTNDRERRILLSQLEAHAEAQKALVKWHCIVRMMHLISLLIRMKLMQLQ